MKIYQISGLGANQNAFKYLQINPDFEIDYLPWLQPEKDENLSHYAERMIEKVNVNEQFILMGLSFGGIMLSEINQLVKPEANILLSTVKDRSELPLYMKFSAKTSFHKFIPTSFFTSEAGLSYAFFRKIYSSKMPNLYDFFEFRDPHYLQWSIDKIVNWETPHLIENYLHIHGNKDIIFPDSNIKNAEIISGGSHILVMQKAKKTSEIINGYLEKL